MLATTEAPPDAPAVRRRRLPRRLLWVVPAVVALGFGLEAYRVCFGNNFHTVVPGRVYRVAQPSKAMLETLIADQQIRSVVNLRGSCDPMDWYLEEARATHAHNVCLEDISFSAGRLPPVQEVRRLVEVLERTPYPIVLHCRRGADRTGMASAVALLLTTDTPLDEAFHQLGLRYGHIAIGRPAQLNQFLDYYREWLSRERLVHTRENFRHWALDCYCPGSCWSELTFTKPPPSTASVSDPITFCVRARNVSLSSWEFKPAWLAGVHLGCHVYDEQDKVVELAKAGLREAVVNPGESIDLTLVVSPLRRPGRYRLQLDMVDEQQCWFYQTGSQPLEVELVVRD
jgi:hypothetical protein